jgi:hypothetical protein
MSEGGMGFGKDNSTIYVTFNFKEFFFIGSHVKCIFITLCSLNFADKGTNLQRSQVVHAL